MKAVQATFNMKSAGAYPFKMVFLDYPHGGGEFEKQRFGDISAAAQALFLEFTRDDRGWSARDNTQIVAFLSVTNTLNEALRKQYHMG